MVRQPESHGRRARGAPLAQALVRPHNVGEAHQQPDLAAVARGAPGQTPGAAPQGSAQPPQRPIPAFHARRLDRRAAWPEPPRRAQAAWTPADHASADLHTRARRVAALDALGVAQGLGGDEPGGGLRPTVPRRRRRETTPKTWSNAGLDACQPAVSKRGPSRTRATTGATNVAACSCVRGPMSTQSSNPLPIAKAVWIQATCRGRRVAGAASTWTPGPSTARPPLAMVRRSALGRDGLQALHRCESHGTHVGSAFVTNAPALTLHQP
jgi:hypothetical protein